MKRIMTVFTIGFSALAFSAAAVSGNGFIDQARVIEAQPQYETITVANPVTECWTETVNRSHHRPGAYIAPIAGGIVGGVVGHQFGKGRGKTALTVAGTLLGASFGHGIGQSHYRPRPTVEHIRRCETVDQYEEQQQLVGYRVKYRYEGQTYYTQTTEHPGKHIPVRVNVYPANGI
jgi:uncharacterized protein YcfJ